MILSESYKNKLKTLSGISLNESKEEKVSWEYQLRDIGGPNFYKRKKGDDNWMFTSAEDFAEGIANGGKLVKWKEKSEK
jgi:hypothetical protein